MRNRNLILVFTALLALICIYQLYFTFASYQDDKRINAMSKTNREKYFENPKNYQKYLDTKGKAINLGLDLRGGMHVVLEVQVSELVRNLANNPADPTLNKAISEAKELQKSRNASFVKLMIESYLKNNPNGRLATLYANATNGLSLSSSNSEVEAYLNKRVEDANENAFKVLRKRIDKFGLTQPNIQRVPNTDRITVELPGVTDTLSVKRVRQLLQGSAKLEFWTTYEFQDIVQYLQQANDRAKEILSEKPKPELKTKEDSARYEAQQKLEKQIQDYRRKTPEELKKDTVLAKNAVLKAKVDSIRKRDSLISKDANQSEAEFRKENPLFGMLNYFLLSNQNRLGKGPMVGAAHRADTSKINKILKHPYVKSILPADVKFLWAAKPMTKQEAGTDKLIGAIELIAIRTNKENKAPLEGDVIVEATQGFNQDNNEAEVNMTMNARGTQIWRRLTGDNVGKAIAIVLDDVVYSYPRVNYAITGGRSQITGNFTVNEAKDLANVLVSGRMMAPIVIAQEQVIGPSLGQKAVSQGLWSMIIATILIMVAMGFYYNKAGRIADIILIANIFFIIGVLASFGLALTLPGIAGLVLTIGIAVDANVLVYERIREELASGKRLKLAISEGFKNALSSILDANITTLLIGIILYRFGSGPIQGFATTLIIGILCSLFTVVLITRIVFDYMAAKNDDTVITFGNRYTMNLLRGFNFDFVGKRRYFIIGSWALIALGIVSMATRGLNYGVDFKGGREYYVAFNKPVETSDIRTKLSQPLQSAPEVKTYGSSNQVLIRTNYKVDNRDEKTAQEVENLLISSLKSNFPGSDPKILSSQLVGPTVAKDITYSAFKSIFLSLIVVFAYLFIRFRRWTFSTGAVVALAHDVLMIFAIFSLLNGIVPFSLELDQAFIAAVLTIMGYSMNDTVVVFDRIREKLRNNPNIDERTNINQAINETLSRTLMTSVLTLLAVIVLFFAGDTLRGFNFALLIGIIVGTYSSIFIATPVVLDFGKKKPTTTETPKTK